MHAGPVTDWYDAACCVCLLQGSGLSGLHAAGTAGSNDRPAVIPTSLHLDLLRFCPLRHQLDPPPHQPNFPLERDGKFGQFEPLYPTSPNLGAAAMHPEAHGCLSSRDFGTNVTLQSP